MNKFIEVYDNIIPPILADQLEKIVIKDKILPFYYVNNISTPNGENFIPGMSCPIPTLGANTPYPFVKQMQLFLEVPYRLAIYLNFSITHFFNSRIFLHLPSPNPTPNEIHNDLDTPHWVCLYYINDSEGDTILFKDDEKTEIQRVSPKKGRIVFFDGSIPHCSSSPASKTRAIFNTDFLGHKLG